MNEFWRLSEQSFKAATYSFAPIKAIRGIFHTFLNAGSVPARILEIIAPAGLEGYFEEVAQLAAAGVSIFDRGEYNWYRWLRMLNGAR